MASNSNRPDFGVFVSRKNGDKNYYTRVGSAWHVSNDGVSIKMEPGVSVSECVLFPPKDDD